MFESITLETPVITEFKNPLKNILNFNKQNNVMNFDITIDSALENEESLSTIVYKVFQESITDVSYLGFFKIGNDTFRVVKNLDNSYKIIFICSSNSIIDRLFTINKFLKSFSQVYPNCIYESCNLEEF